MLRHHLLQKIFALYVIIFILKDFMQKPLPLLIPNNIRQRDFNDADTNHDDCLSFDEFDTEVRKILSSRDDFSSRGFAILPTSAQDTILNDEFHKMDHGYKCFLNVN